MKITFENISAGYAGQAVISELSFTLVRPRIVGVVGPNGSGKTTMFRVMMNTIAPMTGSVTFETEQGVPLRPVFGFAPEHECLLPTLNGFEWVYLTTMMAGFSKAEAFGRAHNSLNLVGLDEERYRLVSTYSTGMVQRVKIASAIAISPDVIILDEPTSGLDPIQKSQVISLMTKIAKSLNIPILFSSHILSEIEMISDDLLILRNGKLLYAGPTAAFVAGTEGAYEIGAYGNVTSFVEELKACGYDPRNGANGTILVSKVRDTADIFAAAARCGAFIRKIVPARSTLLTSYVNKVK